MEFYLEPRGAALMDGTPTDAMRYEPKPGVHSWPAVSLAHWEKLYPGMLALVRPEVCARYRWDGTTVYRERTEPHGDPAGYADTTGYHTPGYPGVWWAPLARYSVAAHKAEE